MDLLRVGELQLHIQHQHSDGSWADLEARPSSAADHDPEREWADGTIYACKHCNELVRVRTGDAEETALR
jgi:hypothetical protein